MATVYRAVSDRSFTFPSTQEKSPVYFRTQTMNVARFLAGRCTLDPNYKTNYSTPLE